MKNFKILYIEDDEDVAEIYTNLIKELFDQAIVEHHLSGNKAIEALFKSPADYSLIISDYKMNELSGADIFKKINGQMLGIPFIILSGYDCTSDESFKGFFDSYLKNAVLIKPVDPEELKKKITWCLEGKDSLLATYSKKLKSNDEKIPLNSNLFMKMNDVPCDVFVKLNDDKFVKIINKKEIFETEIVKKLILKGVKSFYINRSELSAYNDSALNAFNSLYRVKKNKSDDNLKSQHNNKAIEMLKNNLAKCGFSKAMLETADEIIKSQVELVLKVDNISEFLEKFQNFGQNYAHHSRLVSFITISILKEIGWDSESTIHKMGLAALLHDISLPDHLINRHDFVSRSDSRVEFQLKTLEDSNRLAFFNHPEESAQIATRFCSGFPEVSQCILEHHELPSGNGFPNKLNFNKIHPLAGVLHIADVTAELFFTKNFDSDAVRDDLEKLTKFYQRGFYKKPYNAVMKILK